MFRIRDSEVQGTAATFPDAKEGSLYSDCRVLQWGPPCELFRESPFGGGL